MKSIIVDIDEKDLSELGISSDHISFDELNRQFLIRLIRKQRKDLEKLNKQYGFDKFSEEEIFSMVSEAETEYKNEKAAKH
jgi:hypothetical protein